MRLAYLSLMVLTLSVRANEVQATPCVGSDFTTPLPGASNVTTHVVDVPSPRFPGFWQEGTKDGFNYALFANGDATLQAGEESAWRISFSCDASSSECVAEIKGSPPEQAMQVAEQLQQCLQEGEITDPEDVPEETPFAEQSVDGTVSEELDVGDYAEEGSPASGVEEDNPTNLPKETDACGEETIDDDNLTRKLQRMLILAGADPGPVDGIPGSMTNNALVSVLGEPALQLSTDDAIGALQSLICPAGD